MEFIDATLHANEEIYQLLHVKGLDDKDHHSFHVGAGGDISSGIDLEAERIFIKYLHTFGTIVSEESGVIENSDSTVRIIIDPIDGSDNLLSHLPYYGTSVAYFEDGFCTQAMIVNLANGDVFLKDIKGLRHGKIGQKHFDTVTCNPYSKVGIFERSYCSHTLHPLLQSAHIKYRSPGAFALSLAYARDVAFVVYEGPMRTYDIEAGLFMCEGLYIYRTEDIFLVSKDKVFFDKIVDLFISN